MLLFLLNKYVLVFHISLLLIDPAVNQYRGSRIFFIGIRCVFSSYKQWNIQYGFMSYNLKQCWSLHRSWHSFSFTSLALIDVGFEIPNRFVVGYALDYNEYFRDLNVSPEFNVTAAQQRTFESAWEQEMKATGRESKHCKSKRCPPLPET